MSIKNDYEEAVNNLDDSKIQKAFSDSSSEAEILLQNEDKMTDLLEKVEKKMAEIKGLGKWLSKIPLMIQLVRSYIKKEYTEIPIGSVIAIVGSLIYVLSPVDLIPDAIPVIGFADDAAVISVALKLVSIDLENYEEWRRRRDDVV